MSKQETRTGRFQGSGKGFGFFIPDGAADQSGDSFVPPQDGGGAWDGDRVEAATAGEDPLRPGRACVRVVKILERANGTVTGTVQKVRRELWLQPDNERLPGPIKITGRTRVANGEKAAVAVTSFGSAGTCPLGILKETFGPAGTLEAGVEAILYRQNIQRQFPLPAAEQAGTIPQSLPAAAYRGRLDLREETVITIDGASSKDLDDAVSLTKDDKGNWVLGVHIADVSHYVTPGSPLDEEAFQRGTSVYFADQVIPMLPVELSNGICSLNPGVDRLTLSCFMTLDKTGALLDHSIARSVIRSTERMTYEDCNILLGGSGRPHGAAPTDPVGTQYASLAKRYGHILPMLRDMARLSKVLEKRRRARGGLDLETRESYILCDGSGRPVEILARSQGVSEKLIESFMLAANETVARHLLSHKAPGVYRVHEKPSAEKVEGLRAMLSPLGFALKDGSSHSYQKALDAFRDKPQAPAVNMMVLRSLMKARYDVENLGHFGLAAPDYCHFTSPIRRYPDLMVHRCLHALLSGRGMRTLEKSCAKAAVQSSQRELAAQTAERDIEKLYFAQFMAGHIGETFPAAVSGVTRFGLFAALPSGVEGLIPTETLPEDHYLYDEVHMTLTGERTGRVFSFGMALEVVCVHADPATGRVDFRLPGREEVPAKDRHGDSQPRQAGGRPSHGGRPGGTARGKGRSPAKRKGGSRPAMHVPKRGKRGKRR